MENSQSMADTGAVKIAEALDYETERRVYTIAVQVSDGVHDTMATLRIRVLESNDNHPEFTNLPNSVSIYENADNGTFVFNVSATDQDSGVNKVIRYSLAETEKRFVIDPVTGVISVAPSPGFDYESGQTSLSVSVTASDQAGTESNNDEAENSSGFGEAPLTLINDTSLQVTRVLVVNILDFNDEYPIISPIPTVLISEHNENNIFVAQVSAVDNDKPNTDNSEVRFLIEGGDDGKFEINSNTGVITTIPPIDKETKDIYNLIVVAHDLGEPRRSSTVTVTVEIIDIGDEAPQFTQSLYSSNVEENTPENTFVYMVLANDRDQNGTSVVYYTLIDTTDYF